MVVEPYRLSLHSPLVTQGTQGTGRRSDGCRQRLLVPSGSEARRAPAGSPGAGVRAPHPEGAGKGSGRFGAAQHRDGLLVGKTGLGPAAATAASEGIRPAVLYPPVGRPPST